jgi:hypothetical protein
MAGVVETTKTFATNDVITSTVMNNIIDQTLFTSDAIATANTTLALVEGKLKVGTITSNEMGVNAVTTNAIADYSVTPAKLSTYGPSWTSNLDRFDIQQRGLEIGSNITSNGPSVIDFHSSYPLVDYDARIIRDAGINNEFRIEQVGTFPIKFQASGGVKFANAVMPNPAGTAPIYGARAAGNFLYESSSRTLSNNSLNIASVTRSDSGNTYVQFQTELPNANYTVVATYNDNQSTSILRVYNKFTYGFSINHSLEGTGKSIGFIVVG